MEVFETNNLKETYQLGQKLSEKFKTGDCVAITGPLGAGKTALVRGIAMGLGLDDKRLVSSPTYVLVQEYPGRTKIYHVDLYRLSKPQGELADLGIDEMLSDGIVLIEWADRAQGALPTPHWLIEISLTGSESRRFELERID